MTTGVNSPLICTSVRLFSENTHFFDPVCFCALLSRHLFSFFFFFLIDPPTPEIYPLPLHAPLPISRAWWAPPLQSHIWILVPSAEDWPLSSTHLALLTPAVIGPVSPPLDPPTGVTDRLSNCSEIGRASCRERV